MNGVQESSFDSANFLEAGIYRNLASQIMQGTTQANHWLKSFTLLTIVAITIGNPITPRVASATTVEPIEIFVPPPESPVSRGICPAFLEPTIDTIIERPSLARGQWGILVESLTDGTILYSRNADQHLIPASNTKLLTTAAVLQLYDSQTPFRSSSIGEWIRVTNLKSNNGYANTLLSHLGGSQRVKEALAQLGVDPSGYRLVDGSGLSRQNTATPRALVDILKAMNSASSRETFYSSLPVAGVSGTLTNRLRYPSAQGKVHAKTGTLRGVRALSGYLEHPDYGTIVFSILANQPSQSGQVLVGAIDEIVLRLTQLDPC